MTEQELETFINEYLERMEQDGKSTRRKIGTTIHQWCNI